MMKKIAIVMSLIVCFLLITSHSVRAGWESTIAGIVSYIKDDPLGGDSSDSNDKPRIFPFGGKITYSGGGCKIKYKFCPYGACWLGVPLIPIPLGGNTIEVGDPVPSPEGQMFTFPGITDVYVNNNEDTEDVWTLGTGFSPFPIDKINDALAKIPPIPITLGPIDGTISDWHLECSDNDKNVILKIGTGGKDDTDETDDTSDE